MEQEIHSIDDIRKAALTRFAGNPQLSTWDAVEEVVDALSDAQLERIYRSETQRYPWCAEALARGGDFLVSIAVERIAAMMRQDPRILSADKQRTLRPVGQRRSPRTGGSGGGRARRPTRRRRPR